MNDQYTYDVAFSFLTRDEGLAMQINDRLQDRVRTFIYPDRQKEIAFTDGEDTFGKVFREQARMVVVVYRAGWGETKWTRIEQTAIRARGYDLGYGFAKFIPLDKPPSVPPWLPPTQVWLDLERFGLDGVAAVIEGGTCGSGQDGVIDPALDHADLRCIPHCRIGSLARDRLEAASWQQSRWSLPPRGAI